MTLKEIDKRLSRIKKELERIEMKVEKEKHHLKSKKNRDTTFDDWLVLRDKVSSLWDPNVSVEDEMRYQREKN